MSKTRALTVALVVLVLGAAACASTGNTPRRDYDVITAEELAALTTANTLWDVVNQLRPRWFSVRSGRSLGGSETARVVVFQDESVFLGDPGVLRQFRPDAVDHLRYLDAATASASLPGLGGRHVAGAIILMTRPPDDM
ncbi:MAG: hypothetical protein ACOC3J_01650 [Gemmatimonadota bacterium]